MATDQKSPCCIQDVWMVICRFPYIEIFLSIIGIIPVKRTGLPVQINQQSSTQESVMHNQQTWQEVLLDMLAAFSVAVTVTGRNKYQQYMD
jgi:hypothetical protein